MAPSVARTRSYSSPGSRPAATWSVTACWASRSRWASSRSGGPRGPRRAGARAPRAGPRGRAPARRRARSPARRRRGPRAQVGDDGDERRCRSARRTRPMALRTGTAAAPSPEYTTASQPRRSSAADSASAPVTASACTVQPAASRACRIVPRRAGSTSASRILSEATTARSSARRERA